MLPDAYISHQLDGRARLRVAAKRGDAGYFAQLCRALRELPEVAAAQANPRTASLLLEYRGSLPGLARLAQERRLFHLVGSESRSVRAQVRHTLRAMDQDLARISAGSWTFNDALFLALLGFAVHEAMLGRLAAPAATLMWYAFSTLYLPEGQHTGVRVNT
jgi:hypothetical protein